MSNSTDELELGGVDPNNYLIGIGMILGYLLYALTILLGVPLNLLVVYRMLKLSSQLTDFYSRGTGIPLCLLSMAIFDLFSLLAICIHYILSFEIDLTPFLHGLMCKLAIFTLHYSTTMSIWSWLIASSIRYLSIYHPLFHFKLWRLPSLVLLFVFAVSGVVNLPILFMVNHSKESNECTQEPLFASVPELNRVVLCIEILWSFCAPSCIILFLDSSVYFCRKNRQLESNLGQRRQTNRKTKRVLWRWLCIGLIDVLLNAPENIFRLIVILDLINLTEVTAFYLLARMLAQVLYYSQFAFNVFYLVLFIYDKSTRFNDSNKSIRARESITHSTHHEALCKMIVECHTK